MFASYFSDLMSYGVTEDGRDFIAEVYGVTLEDENGRRWKHHQIFHGAERRTDFDDDFGHIVWFEDVRANAEARAKAFAQKVSTHIAKGGSINFDHWNETDPAYGSNAYQELDSVGYFKEREKREDQAP